MPTPLRITRHVVASGRARDLDKGLFAGLLRQAVYTTARLGFFETMMTSLTTHARQRDRDVAFRERAGAGLVAGGLAAMIGNPADLVLIRVQTDGFKPRSERAEYKSVFNALVQVTRSEVIGVLWAGVSPTVVRAMALNLGQLTFFF